MRALLPLGSALLFGCRLGAHGAQLWTRGAAGSTDGAPSCDQLGTNDRAVVLDIINELRGSATPPEEISTKHAVLVAPGEPLLAGRDLAANAYASMPTGFREGKFGTTFTKFVVVGHAEQAKSPLGISLGDDVCGNPGWVDKDAAQYLRMAAPKYLRNLSPKVLGCKKDPKSCPERLGETLRQQLPFLSVISNASLPGNTLPVMMQTQAAALGVSVGDALALLVGSGGVWEAESVLFVFGADLSAGVEADIADRCDLITAKVVTEKSLPAVSKHMTELWKAGPDTPCGKATLPRSYGTILAASRLAGILGLTQTRYEVARSPMPKEFSTNAGDAGAPVLGYGSMMFWQDQGSAGQKLSSQR